MSYKPVEIIPADYKGHVMARGVAAVEKYKALGIRKSSEFIKIVVDHTEHYDGISDYKKLEGFWHYRCRDPRLIEQLEKLFPKVQRTLKKKVA